MQSKAKSVAEYLASLPPDRRAAIAAVREVILKNLDKDYAEGMQSGMIGYFIPHSVYPPGYHCDPKSPLPFAGLASQKNHMSVYLMAIYGNPAEEKRLRDQFAKAGKKADMGKCCIRFRKLEDLPLGAIGEAVRRMPASRYIALYEKAIRSVSKAATARAARQDAAKAGPARKAASTRRKPAKVGAKGSN